MENNQSSFIDKVYFYKHPQKMQLVILDLVKGSIKVILLFRFY